MSDGDEEGGRIRGREGHVHLGLFRVGRVGNAVLPPEWLPSPTRELPFLVFLFSPRPCMIWFDVSYLFILLVGPHLPTTWKENSEFRDG